MKVPASYYETPASAPRLIHVRVHVKDDEKQGDLKGTNLNYAEREEVEPQLVFDLAEVDNPPAGGYVVISADEGYRIGQTKPRYGFTQRAVVARMRSTELVGKVLPGDL